jgi:hypothetical protein
MLIFIWGFVKQMQKQMFDSKSPFRGMSKRARAVSVDRQPDQAGWEHREVFGHFRE